MLILLGVELNIVALSFKRLDKLTHSLSLLLFKTKFEDQNNASKKEEEDLVKQLALSPHSCFTVIPSVKKTDKADKTMHWQSFPFHFTFCGHDEPHFLSCSSLRNASYFLYINLIPKMPIIRPKPPVIGGKFNHILLRMDGFVSLLVVVFWDDEELPPF